ncbi:MAG: IclR family transcriptional regulator [Acidimicrobiia bacterium]
MARPALAAARTVAILDFLAAHPTESYTLSELSRRLGINGASAHAVLTELTDAGYLARHPQHKTFRLGPVVIALGHAALESHRAIDVARDEMKRLATELDVECEASAAVAEETVVLARAGPRLPGWSGPAVGQRLPLVAPVGAVFMAWAPPDAVNAWLARRSGANERARARFRHYLDVVCGRGYSVTLRVAAERPIGRALARLADEPGAGIAREALAALVGELGHDDYQLVDADSAGSYAVTSIAAPVFGPNREVALALALLGFRGPLSGAEIREYGERVRDRALLVTRQTHGRPDAALAGAIAQGG